jgi:acetylornithine deacetylase/succinyl-diaminopimelate desuccinylase-like protein
MKDMDATWVDMLIRFKESHYRPKRTLKLALTCGEEASYAFNGAQWLANNHPDWVAAEFALNEGGGGRTDGHGKLLLQGIQVGEKAVQNYQLETVNAGGHSSIPIRDNAIYELGESRNDDLGRAMIALVKNPDDSAANAIVSKDRIYHSMLRTTCVATLLEGGHANNALPQHAAANINCRIFPGETVDATQATLASVIADPGVKITLVPPIRPLARPPPLDPKILGPATKLVAKYFPGVSLIPSMSTGATDGIFYEAIGIPVYGVPGGWGDPDGNGVHGLNERISQRAVFVSRDFLTDLVKIYAND